MESVVEKSKAVLVNIHLLCAARHMSLIDLSCELGEGYPPSHAMEYFKGVRAMDMIVLTAVAKRFDVPVSDLMAGT